MPAFYKTFTMSTEYSDVEFDAMQQELYDYKKAIADLSGENSDLKGKINDCELGIRELKDDIDFYKDKSASLESDIIEKDAELNLTDIIQFGSGSIQYKTNGNLDADEVMDLFTSMLSRYTMAELREKLK